MAFTWDPVQTQAKAKGTLVYAMSQSQTDVLSQPGPWGSAYDGFCIGLALEWISLAYKGSDFAFSAGSKECTVSPWEATVSQNLSDATNAASWIDFYASAVAPFKMTVSDGLRAKRAHGPTGTFLKSIAVKAYGCYAVHLLRTGGAHTIAMRHAPDGHFHLFDGNYGHFRAKGPDAFKTMLSWYLSATGYRTRYDKLTGVLGIRPPINLGG